MVAKVPALRLQSTAKPLTDRFRLSMEEMHVDGSGPQLRDNSTAQCMPVPMQHFLYFFFDPHGHGSLRPTSAPELDVWITLSTT